MSNREPLFWNPAPWRYEKETGTIWDASGDSVLETAPDGHPYVEPDVGEAIVLAVNLHFGGSMSLDLEWIFTYQPPTSDEMVAYEKLRSSAKTFAHAIVELTPPCADQTAAIRKVREAVMTANAAIALKGRS